MELKSNSGDVTKDYVRFMAIVVAAHTIGYLFAGGIAYQLIVKDLWEGSDSLLSSYLRTPGNKQLWNFAMIWQIPGQLLRSLLIGLALLPLYSTIKQWPAKKRFLFFSSLLFIVTHLSAAAPSPANIEGLVYMRPEFVRSGFVKMQAEMIMYSSIAGLIFARFAYKNPPRSLG